MEILQNETERQIAAKICKGNPSNRDIGLALMLVIEKMWSEERLATFVRQVHSAECANFGNNCSSLSRSFTIGSTLCQSLQR